MLSSVLFCFAETCVAELFAPGTPDLEVQGSSLTHLVVSLDKELYGTLFFFTQVYKWVLAIYCWGVSLQIMDKHPIQGGVAILLGMIHAKEIGTSSHRFGL